MKVLSYLVWSKKYRYGGYDSDLIEIIKRVGFLNSLGYNVIGDVIAFYSQPFKPELITELFEPLLYKDDYAFNESKGILDKSIRVIDSIDGEYYIDIDLLPISTLDDFINDCQRAGIELEWRAQ